MTHENNPVNNQQVYSALMQLSERDLGRMLKSVKALRKDLRLIPPSSLKAVTAAQDLLKIWSDELDQIIAAKQAKDTNSRLRNWDNEGGAVDHTAKQRSLSETASEKQPVVLSGVADIRMAIRG